MAFKVPTVIIRRIDAEAVLRYDDVKMEFYVSTTKNVAEGRACFRKGKYTRGLRPALVTLIGPECVVIEGLATRDGSFESWEWDPTAMKWTP